MNRNDDRFLVHYSPICSSCVHLIAQNRHATCAAYPDGIPLRFKKRGATHTSLQIDQTGTTVYAEIEYNEPTPARC